MYIRFHLTFEVYKKKKKEKYNIFPFFSSFWRKSIFAKSADFRCCASPLVSRSCLVVRLYRKFCSCVEIAHTAVNIWHAGVFSDRLTCLPIDFSGNEYRTVAQYMAGSCPWSGC